MKTRKVYVVTSGSYSDYCIGAVFSSRKRAEKYCLIYNHGKQGIDVDKYSGYGVEEYVLNDWNTKEVSYTLYTCRIEIKTGNIDVEWDKAKVGIKPIGAIESELKPYSDYRDDSGKVLWENPAFITAYSCKSQEHAKKIAIDYRTKILAEQAEGLRDEDYRLITEGKL